MKKIVIAVLFAALCIIQSCEEIQDSGYLYEMQYMIENKTETSMIIIYSSSGYSITIPPENIWTYNGYTKTLISEKPLPEKEVKEIFDEMAQLFFTNIKDEITVKISDRTLNKTVFTPDFWTFSFLDKYHSMAAYTLILDEDMIKKIGYAE